MQFIYNAYDVAYFLQIPHTKTEQTTGLLPKDYAKYDNRKRIVYEV